jgi:hypothetical protein
LALLALERKRWAGGVWIVSEVLPAEVEQAYD